MWPMSDQRFYLCVYRIALFIYLHILNKIVYYVLNEEVRKYHELAAVCSLAGVIKPGFRSFKMMELSRYPQESWW